MMRVLVVGQTPPPWHGQAIMIEKLLAAPMRQVRLFHVRMSFSDSIDEIGRARIGKVAHLLAVILRIVICRIVHRTSVLYYPPAGPNRVPMFRDIAILLCTRWMFRHTVFHFHAGGISQLYDGLPGWLRLLFRWAYFDADVAVRVSHGAPHDGLAMRARRECVAHYGIEDQGHKYCDRRRACLAGSQSERALVSAGASRASLLSPIAGPIPSVKPNPPRILFVGILRESKGLSVLLDACGRLAAQEMQFAVDVMGQFQSPEFEAQTRRQIDEQDLGERVAFLGVQQGEAKWSVFGAADIFCFPTFYEAETFGIVLLEAMSAGLPIVATRWRGIPEIVDDGQTGLLVDVRDPIALAEKLALLIEDERLRRQYGDAGRRKFASEFTVQHYWGRMAEIFTGVLEDRP